MVTNNDSTTAILRPLRQDGISKTHGNNPEQMVSMEEASQRVVSSGSTVNDDVCDNDCATIVNEQQRPKQQQQQHSTTDEYCVLAFYQFFTNIHTEAVCVNLEDSEEDIRTMEQQWKNALESNLRSYEARGTIRISTSEGMNGTICFLSAHRSAIIQCLHEQQHKWNKNRSYSRMRTDDESVLSHPLRMRLSSHSVQTFHRLSIRIKNEIVTMGLIPKNWILNSSEDHDDNRIFNDTCHYPTSNINGNELSKSEIQQLDRDLQQQQQQYCYVRPNRTGIYVRPGPQWDELLYDPQCLVIDTRNEYEVQIGTFVNAVSPHTTEFTEFPTWLYKQLQQGTQSLQYDKIAMFCTGGIRCEKATALCIQMISNLQVPVFANDDVTSDHDTSNRIMDQTNNAGSLLPVYHLEGGILAYLENAATTNDVDIVQQDIPTEVQKQPNHNASTILRKHDGKNFIGECFVFDQRVAVTYGLHPTSQYVLCHACRRPVHIEDTVVDAITPKKEHDEDVNDTVGHRMNGNEKVMSLEQSLVNMNNRKYHKGICCPACCDDVMQQQEQQSHRNRQRYIERQKQIELAQKRQVQHIYDPKYKR
jgi:predicted sulfurtransferase